MQTRVRSTVLALALTTLAAANASAQTARRLAQRLDSLAGSEVLAKRAVGSFSGQYVPPATLITNSRITHRAGFGINAMWLASTFNTPDLTAPNTFQSNARCRQTYNGVTPPATCPANGGCTAP